MRMLVKIEQLNLQLLNLVLQEFRRLRVYVHHILVRRIVWHVELHVRTNSPARKEFCFESTDQNCHFVVATSKVCSVYYTTAYVVHVPCSIHGEGCKQCME